MKTKIQPTIFIVFLLVLTSLSCGIFGSAPGEDGSSEPKPETGAKNNPLRQWANSARASSEYSNPDWAASQATGAPNTLECGDTQTAWASYNHNTVEWLEVSFGTPVTPTEINIYESYSPSQITSVEILDTRGVYHQVYTGEPKTTNCPYTLSVSVSGADYQAASVKITVDQSQGESWDEIDAVELVGQ
jgi:hypothetical protein